MTTDTTEAHRRRLAELDPLVVAGELPAGEVITSGGSLGVVRPVDTSGQDTLWQHDRVCSLDVRSAAQPDATELGHLLDEWLRTVDPECSAELTLPSRDTSAVAALTRRDFTPATVLAVRPAGHGPEGVGVREARPDDLEPMVALAVALHTYEEQFGTVPKRPDAARIYRTNLAAHLREHVGWSWVVGAAGTVAGMCVVEPPESAGWITGTVAAAPAAYLSELVVDAAERRRGAGRALVATAHRALDGAGIEATLLHYGALNPLSGPFWHRQGYRPLLTTWQRYPANR